MPSQLSRGLEAFLHYRREIDRGLSRLVASSPLQEVLRYHLGLDGWGGKRVRPILFLIAYRGLGGKQKKAMPAALALELVHNFSLAHDDIQDEDEFRHSCPTLWTIWGKGVAFNIGWLLWLMALSSLRELLREGFPEEVVLRAERLLQESCLEMIEGQFLDISFGGRWDINLESYLKMVEKKTGSLFSASLKMGGLLAAVSNKTLDRLGDCGRKLGVAFQIKDDILGIWGREERTGKPASDLRKKKKTMPVVYLLEMGDKILPSLYQKERITEEDIGLIFRLFSEAGAEEFAKRKLEHYLEEFKEGVKGIGFSSQHLHELEELGRFLGERDY